MLVSKSALHDTSRSDSYRQPYITGPISQRGASAINDSFVTIPQARAQWHAPDRQAAPGNYVGALQNWVGMQEKYECFFEVADWHALTTDYADTSLVKEISIEVVIDWLAAGLDPEKSVIFIQSHVRAHAELHLLFSMITPLGWLERVPSYKEQQENIKGKDLTTYGFLGYPCCRSADILMYKADVVPVGEDQVAHVELTREIARRFNGFYGASKASLPRAAVLAHAGSQTARRPMGGRCRSHTGTR